MSESLPTSKRMRRRVVTVAAGLSVFTAGSIAFAAWTTNSEPWAAGATGAAQHPSAVATVVDQLYPGDCSDVLMKISNPNNHAVEITSIAANGSYRGFEYSPPKPNETVPASRLQDFLSTKPAPSSLVGKRIPAEGSREITVPNAVCLSAQADDARMNTKFEVGYFVAYDLVPGNEAS